ncbi:glutamyl-tRNA reductase [uncultured Clostridium sp.]|uniref:glutamyl-tRNA reductase n=1 Tax=uncultured Clostridium sp. TaxID=59620 RepID=UPI00262D1FCF|nr:glutamyl-tRNA reductase [uncultured Clostridium sp.]
MIGLVGVKKDTPLEIREKFSVSNKMKENAIEKLKDSVEELIILSTCNRTEIYFNHFLEDEEILKKIFEAFNFDKKYMEYVFIVNNDIAIKHLFLVVCGFHSKILGEDQILGQIKDAFNYSLEKKLVKNELLRLFQSAITCGKRFRYEAELYKIPVSSASISVNKCIEDKLRTIMVLGYGDVGKLVVKGLLSHKYISKVFIVVRDKNKVLEIDERVEVLTFEEKNRFINEVEGIISCTAAPHTVVKKDDLNVEGNKIDIFDLALPRDVDLELYKNERFKILNIDNISKIDDINKELRKEKMEEFKFLIERFITEYKDWLKIREISPYIKQIREKENLEKEKRYNTYKRKTRREEKIVDTMIKSMGNLYASKAIEVLKEEALKGREEECLEILKKIFL